MVKDLRSQHAERVAAGDGITLTLSATGGVFSCGASTQGQQGRDASKAAGPRPISRLWPLGVVQVACGGAHCAALLEDGRLLTWGRGRFGALGLLDTENRSTPQARGGGMTRRGLAARALHRQQAPCRRPAACSPCQASLACPPPPAPQVVRSLAGVRGRQVSCGEDHTCLLDQEGGLYTWGR